MEALSYGRGLLYTRPILRVVVEHILDQQRCILCDIGVHLEQQQTYAWTADTRVTRAKDICPVSKSEFQRGLCRGVRVHVVVVQLKKFGVD